MIIKLDTSKKINIFYIFTSITVVLISKQVTPALALMCLFVFILKTIYKKEFKKNWIFIIICIFISFGFWHLWFIIRNINIENFINSVNTSASEVEPIVEIDDSYYLSIIKNYNHAILHSPIISFFGIKLHYFVLNILITIALFIVLKFKAKLSNPENIIYCVTYVLGFIGYAFMMVYLYMTVFGEWDATNLASFERYMGTIIYLGISLLIMLVFSFSSGYKSKIAITIVLLCMTNIANLAMLNPENRYNYKENIQNKELFRQIEEFIKPEDKVLVVSQTRDYFIEIYVRYLYPDIDIEYTSLNFNEYDKNYYKDFEFEEWQDYYSNYDYVYTYNTDEIFYRDFWKGRQKEDLLNDRLYSVNGKELTLVPWYSYAE